MTCALCGTRSHTDPGSHQTWLTNHRKHHHPKEKDQ